MKKKVVNLVEKKWWLILVSVGLLVYSLAMMLSYGQSVWFDEGYSILLAKQSFSELFALTSVDAHPPFYYILLKLWGEIFSFNEFALRSLSAILAAGAVVLAVNLTKKQFGWKVAVLALPFVVLAPFVLRYAYEIRMYALAMFIGVLGTCLLVKAYQAKKLVWWVLYAVTVTLGMLTLYMMAPVWLAHLVWLIVISRKAKLRIRQWKWLWAYVLSVVLFLPYIPVFLYQLGNSALPGIGSEITLTTMVDIVTVLTMFTPQWLIGGWLSILIVVLLIGLIIVGFDVLGRGKLKGVESDNMLLVILMAIVPILFFIATSLPPNNPIFVVRYLAHVSIWIYLLVGIILALALISTKFKNRTYQLISILTVFVLAGGVLTLLVRGNFIFERVQTPKTQQIRADLAKNDYSNCSKGATIITDDPYTYIDSVYYFEGCNIYFYAGENVEKKGGYAPLHDSKFRIGDPEQIKSSYLVHLHWGNPLFKPTADYQLVDTNKYDKQRVDVYILSGDDSEQEFEADSQIDNSDNHQ